MGVIARQYLIRGRVQGVGFRYFVELAAHELGLTAGDQVTIRSLDGPPVAATRVELGRR